MGARDAPGDLRNGTLQMLRVKGQPQYNTIVGQTVGEVLASNWVTIDDPDPANAEDDASAVFHQGRAKGGAKFLGGEGLHLPRRRRRVRVVRRRRRGPGPGLAVHADHEHR